MDQMRNRAGSRTHSPDPGGSAPSITQIRRTLKGNIVLLSIFTAMYLAPIALASSIRNVLIAIALFVVLFAVGLAITRAPLAPSKRPTKRQAGLVGLTSMLELVAVIAGLIIGFVADAWWPFGVLLVGSVALHFLTLLLAYRRRSDYFALTLVVVAFALLVVSPISPLWDLWAVAGGIVAACTALYIVEPARTLRATKPAAEKRAIA
ncbi:hypothetical protein [uncultured Actinomyces sp.]|uniref:hypothetical protein n=1 Tax=uncultured Actinomyces sp. TaxID=249061 RepID=UPI0026271EA0|nr:hypothetical protein [uncultured Actinomyces sp.]